MGTTIEQLVTGQESAVTKPKNAFTCTRAISEHDAYDVYLNLFYLPTLKHFVGYYKLWNEVMFWFTQIMCYDVYIPLHIRSDMSRNAG